jgi:ectoine hydroxylase-related dioxygenase (phytanoyl-CoA dioxygenase family)
MTVTVEQIEFFRTNGFVVIPDLLTDAELDDFEPIVTEAVAVRSAPDDRPLEERSPYQQSFQQCINLWEDYPAIRPLTFNQRIGAAAGALLGVDALRLWHDQALYKRAHGRATDAHQDQPYWPMTETNTITAWIPLQGSTFANRAMGYLPGSHTVGLRKFQNIFGADDVSEFMNSPEIAGIEPVYVEVPRGSVSFHHGLTVHMAYPNTTDTDRAVHTMILFADGSTRSTRMFHFSVDRDGIEVGAPIDGLATPIMWPRPEDDFPRLPAPFNDQVRQIAGIGLLPE